MPIIIIIMITITQYYCKLFPSRDHSCIAAFPIPIAVNTNTTIFQRVGAWSMLDDNDDDWFIKIIYRFNVCSLFFCQFCDMTGEWWILVSWLFRVSWSFRGDVRLTSFLTSNNNDHQRAFPSTIITKYNSPQKLRTRHKIIIVDPRGAVVS